MDLVLSCYFTEKPDPQRGKFVRADDFDYIWKWHKSIHSRKMNALVFTDCSEDFTLQHCSKRLTFIKTRLSQDERMSINDERIKLFIDYLRAAKNVERVFISDISDVVFNKDIFKLMGVPDSLYVGNNNATWNMKPVIYPKLRHLVGDQNAQDMRNEVIYNPGTFGGDKKLVLGVLDRTWRSIEYGIRNDLYNVNMPAFNFALMVALRLPIITGYPYFTKFKKYENDSPAAVRHK